MTLDPYLARLVGAGGPFEIHTEATGREIVRKFRNPPFTLSDVYRRARRFPSRQLLSYGGKTFDCQSIFVLADAVSGKLDALGIAGSSARVALCMTNSADWVSAFAAITSAGAVAVLIDPRTAVEQVQEALGLAACSVAVTDVSGSGLIASAAPHLPLVVTDECRGAESGPARVSPPDAEAPAVVLFTSGTTGRPKGVLHTHRSLVSGLKNMMLGAAMLSHQNRGKMIEPSRKPATLVLAPFANIAGLAQVLLAMMTLDQIVLPVSAEVQELAELIQRHGVRSISGIHPPELRDLLENHSGTDLRSLTSFFLHGGALQEGLVRAIETALPSASVSTGYGLTETAGTVAVASLRDIRERPGTSGRVLPTADIFFGDDGRADGARPILLRGPMLMRGYLGQPEAGVFVQGCFPTGDLGHVDSDGYLFVRDRVSRMLAMDGIAVPSTEMEETALADARVVDAAVVKNPSQAAAYTMAIVIRPGARSVPQAISALLTSRYPGMPDIAVVPIERIPRTTSGKHDHAALRKLLAVIAPSDPGSG